MSLPSQPQIQSPPPGQVVAQALGESAAVPIALAERMRVLLVEDTDADSRLIQESIKRSSQGHRVELRHVTTLKAAIDLVKAEPFDCVLLDLGLPDGRGVQNVTAIREACPSVAIVVMTGLDDEATAIEALKLGAQEYAVKGLPQGEVLVRLLRHAIERDHMLREINELRKQEYFRATHDLLTGLPNRQLFYDRVRQAIELHRRKEGQLAICYIDLDGFKPVNDSFGHAVGDLLLKSVAAELSKAVRASDSVARLGGDEFATLLAPPSSRLEAQQISQRIIEKIQAISSIAENPVRIGASIGIVLFPDNGEDLETLLQHADLAMYAAKSGGRGTYRFYNAEMHGEREVKGKLVAEMNEALRLKQFFLHYQPWVDTQKSAISGIETLLRWRAPGGEVRHPLQFMAAAEESGLVSKITRQLLPEAAGQWLEWKQQGLKAGRLAYNVSLRELRDSQFVSELGGILLGQGMSPEDMQINLPGGAAVLAKTGQYLVQRVTELRDLGFRVLLDQFSGDGASLAALSGMPASALRLDAELVNGLEGVLADEMSARIARTLQAAAGSKLEVIVPEVETRRQYDLLRNMGCRYMQGFLLARPGDGAYIGHVLRGAPGP